MMFRTVTIFFLILTCTSLVFSQERYFSGGMYFGGNGIDIRGEANSIWRGRNSEVFGGLGIAGGLYAERVLYKNISAAVEIRYIQKGSVYDFTNQYNETQREALRIQYIEVPVMISYKIKPQHGYCIVQAGAAYGHIISSKYIFNELAVNTQKPQMNNFKNHDISAVVALKVPMNEKGKDNFFLGIKGSYSLISIHNYYDLRNLCYGLELSYRIL